MKIEDENKRIDGVIGKLTVYVSPHLTITQENIMGLNKKRLRAEHPSILVITKIIKKFWLENDKWIDEECNTPILKFQISPWNIQPVVFELSWEGLKKLVKQGEELLKSNEKGDSIHEKNKYYS